MHPAAYAAMQRMIDGITINRKHVLEVGAYDVNGSVRPLFQDAARYHGIDIRAGKGVDEVADILDYTPEKPYEIVISTEMLEHTAAPRKVLKKLMACVAPGGYLLLTCASAERAPHDCDGAPLGRKKEAYSRISADDLAAWFPDGWTVDIEHNARDGDLYVKAKAPTAAQAKQLSE